MDQRIPLHQFMPPFQVARQLLDGKSLTRTLFNLALTRYSISGKVLDLGSKNSNSSYYKYLRQDPDTQIVFTDLFEQPGVVQLNVEQTFPFPERTFDSVLAFHLMEHVYHFQQIPREVFRVLRPAGRVFVSIPFIHEFHPDPDDYFRLSESALRRVWEDGGFKCSHCEAIGEGVLTWVATKLPTLVLPALLRPITATTLYLLTTPIDRLIARRPRVANRSVPQRFALELLAVFVKPPG